MRAPQLQTTVASLALLLTLSVSAGAAKKAKPKQEEQTKSPAAAGAKPTKKLKHGVFEFTSYPVAWTVAQKSQRPILVYVSSPSCPYCTRMIRNTYLEKGVKKLVGDSFETVYVDRAIQPRLAAKLNVRLFPTTIVVSPKNKVMDVVEGYIDNKQFTARLRANLTTAKTAAEAPATQR